MNAKSTKTESNTEDGLQRLLRDFFHAEMAKTTFSPPDLGAVSPALIAQPRSILARSRLVLALSALLVIGTLWFLVANRSTSVLPPPAGVNNSAAERHDLFPKSNPEKPDSSNRR